MVHNSEDQLVDSEGKVYSKTLHLNDAYNAIEMLLDKNDKNKEDLLVANMKVDVLFKKEEKYVKYVRNLENDLDNKEDMVNNLTRERDNLKTIYENQTKTTGEITNTIKTRLSNVNQISTTDKRKKELYKKYVAQISDPIITFRQYN